MNEWNDAKNPPEKERGVLCSFQGWNRRVYGHARIQGWAMVVRHAKVG